MKDLQESRKQIDEIDQQLLELFQKRMQIVGEVAEYKKENHLSSNDPSREKAMLERNLEKVEEKWQPYYRDFQENMFRISKKYQKTLLAENEPLLKDSTDYSTYIDNAFLASQKAKADLLIYPEETVNATVGTLYGRDNTIAAFDTVYQCYNSVSNKRKASYAGGIQGNADFNEAAFQWVNRLNNIHLAHKVIATPGGTGAISLAVTNCLNPNETLLIPSIAWGSYRVMAAQNALKVDTYEILADGEVSVEDIKKKSTEIMAAQKKLLVIINDPCQNPTGITLGKEKWQDLIDYLKELSAQGPIVILNDIAYFDYARDYAHATEYMETFNGISENMAVIIAFSCSKSLTAYGMRLGASILLTKEEEKAQHIYNSFIRTARASWSNVNNGFMDCFVDLMKNHQEEYLKEKDHALEDLNRRSELFIQQAQECGLDVYPYSEGFFVTCNVPKEKVNAFNEALTEHHIYGVKFSNGIRIAVCGLSYEKVDGLAFRMKEILSSLG